MASRRTQARLAIAAALIAGRESVQWGYELSRQAGVGAGSMYPYLSELLDCGYLTDGWEDPALTGGRAARRYYRVTEDGERYLRQFLDAGPVRRSVRRRVARAALAAKG